MPLLEQVFKKSGIPDITFVEPKEFPKVSVALRTPGRGIVVEGPSGIGKTTCLHRAIEKEGLNAHCLLLSGRKKSDIELIESLPELVPFQIVIVDDFHKLDQHIQNMLADLLKVLADEERQDSKLVLVGINRAGQNLIDYAPDLLNRVEVIRLGKANDERIKHLIQLGEESLRCTIHCSPNVIDEVQGSFAMAQLICHELCVQANHLSSETEGTIDTSLPSAREAILRDLHPRFFSISRDFSTGKRLRKEGRAPYLHLLLWLSETEEGVLDIKDALATNQKMKGSVTQVIEKGYSVSHSGEVQ